MHSSVASAHSHCRATFPTVHLQDSPSCKTDTLSPLHTKPLSPQALATTFTLCLYECDSSRDLICVGSQCLSFRSWLASLSIMSSRYIHAGVRVSFLLRLSNITFHLSIHPAVRGIYFLAAVNNAAFNMNGQISPDPTFSSFE